MKWNKIDEAIKELDCYVFLLNKERQHFEYGDIKHGSFCSFDGEIYNTDEFTHYMIAPYPYE